MDLDQVAAWRMHQQRLWGAPAVDPEDALRQLGACQAQEFAYAKWSLAQRAGDVGNAVITRLFAGGRVIRTHALRPTWHFVLAEDIRWVLQATAARVHVLNGNVYRQVGLTGGLPRRTARVIAAALADGRHRTRKELAEELAHAGVAAAGVRLAYILMWAELEAVICSGAPRGRQQTYALLDQRAPHATRLEPDEALARLTERYFSSRGPSTIMDFTTWSSLTVAQARRGLAMVGGRLERLELGGRTYWLAPAEHGLDPRSPRVDLVQAYDEYVMGYSFSRDHMRPRGGVEPAAFGDSVYWHHILLDGHLIGHWKHTFEKGLVLLHTFFYRPLSNREERALRVAADRYGAHWGVPAELSPSSQ